MVGVTSGSGFILRKLGGGPARWSAPLFVSITEGSAGAIIGVEKVGTCQVLITMTGFHTLPCDANQDHTQTGDACLHVVPLNSTRLLAPYPS